MGSGDKMDTEEEMVRDDFAWRDVRYDKAGDFTDAEREAREKRRGLWADTNPVPPWEYLSPAPTAAASVPPSRPGKPA
jgi:endonuclease YncB( thermonuclease family)